MAMSKDEATYTKYMEIIKGKHLCGKFLIWYFSGELADSGVAGGDQGSKPVAQEWLVVLFLCK
jgi:hypothetical protein